MEWCISKTSKPFININTILTPSKPIHTKSLVTLPYAITTAASRNFSRFSAYACIKRNEFSKKGNKKGRSLVRISVAEGTANYIFSLRDLHLDDLVGDGDPHEKPVSISLSIQKHTGSGLSVDGLITTSFTRWCSNCSSPYCREIKTNFRVFVLPTPRHNHPNQIPDLVYDDPSVIYVKPGCQAHLDSLIQDTIRLSDASPDETCSDFCKKQPPRMIQHVEVSEPKASPFKRCPELLELKDHLNNSKEKSPGEAH